MLVIRPRTQGAGIIDVISKVANSALAKKVINSTLGKKVIQQATKENFKKAANSAIGKQLQSAVVKGVANASEKAANSASQKLGFTVKPGQVAEAAEKAINYALQNISEPEKIALEKVYASSLAVPAAGGHKRKLSTKPGRSKKRRRAKALGTGIILE